MRDDLDTRTPVGARTGMGMGTMAAIAAAVLIIGALFFWPRDATSPSASTSPSTTVGQTRTTPAPAPAAPAPAPAAPSQSK
jgi:hypothetical protein